MFKEVAKPIQEVLLRKKLCPGCTHPLVQAKTLKKLTDTKKMVQCKCRRIYIHDSLTDTYRRATLEEEQHFLNKKVEIQ